MNFLFRRLFRNVIEPVREAKFLTEVVSGSAYQVFLDRNFREMVDFKNQNQTEQDRIFNELVVTGLVLLLSTIKDNLLRITSLRQEFWQGVYEKIPETFVNWLSSLKIQQEYVEIWKKLIDLRFEEYKENQVQTRHVWIEELIKSQEDEDFNDAAVRVETLTVSSMLHITRSKAKKDDPLRKHLRTWISVLNNKLEKRIGW